MKLQPHEQYLLTKLSASIHDMAMSRENFKERLRAVFLEHLEPAIRETELPDSTEKEDMVELKKELTKLANTNRGSINDTIDAMSHQKAKKLCQKICDTDSGLNARAIQ